MLRLLYILALTSDQYMFIRHPYMKFQHPLYSSLVTILDQREWCMQHSHFIKHESFFLTNCIIWLMLKSWRLRHVLTVWYRYTVTYLHLFPSEINLFQILFISWTQSGDICRRQYNEYMKQIKFSNNIYSQIFTVQTSRRAAHVTWIPAIFNLNSLIYFWICIFIWINKLVSESVFTNKSKRHCSRKHFALGTP